MQTLDEFKRHARIGAITSESLIGIIAEKMLALDFPAIYGSDPGRWKSDPASDLLYGLPPGFENISERDPKDLKLKEVLLETSRLCRESDGETRCHIISTAHDLALSSRIYVKRRYKVIERDDLK